MSELVKENNELLQGAIDALTSHIAILDRQGKIIKINKAWRKFAQVNSFTNDNYGLGSNYIESCFPVEKQESECDPHGVAAANGILEVINGQRHFFELEYPCHSPAEKRWFIMRTTFFGDKNDLYIVVAHEDITRRKEAEIALRESEEGYRVLAETASDAIIRIDQNSRIQFISHAGEKIFGHRIEAMVGQPLSMLMPEELRGAHAEEFQRYLETGERQLSRKSLELPARHRDGHIFPVEISISDYVRDGQHFFIGVARDISQRKQTEETLREKQTMLSLAMKSSRMGVWERDIASDSVYWSEELEEIFGLEKGSFAQKRNSFYDLMYEDDRAKILNEIEKAVREFRDYSIEFRFHHADGSIRWMEGRGQAVYDDKNKPVRLYGIGIDITERKRVEQALRESEDSLRTLADSVPQLVWMADPDGSIFWYNERWYQYTGKTPHDMEGWGWQSVHEPKILPKVIDRWRHSVLTGEEFEMEFPLRGADGSFRWFLTRVIPLRDAENKIVRWFGTNTDVDDSRQMRDALTESENRFRAMTNNAPMLVWISGTDKARTYFNQTWLDFTGRTMEQEINNGWTESLHSEDFEYYLDVYNTNFDKQSNFEVEYRLQRYDGEYRWLIDRAAPLFTPEGIFKGYIGSCVDVTERKQAEQQREEILRREHIARIEAEAANNAKDEFLSVLSHELRTPLNAMFGWIKMLRAGMLDEDRTAQALEVLERNVKLQNNLIEDLLDVSRIITGKMRIESEKVDLVSIIETAIEAARPNAEAKNIKLSFQSESDTQIITGDVSRLQQIINNLINNGIKFTDQKGSVSLYLSEVGGKVRLEVRDTGIGISKKFLPLIFDRFKQADSTTRRAHSGLGLGLTIVRNLTELHGGTVKAFSNGEGFGTTFTVEFPLDEYSEQKSKNIAAASAIEPDGSLNGAKVLLVDDDCDGLMPLHLLLEMNKAEVECVDSAQAALIKISQNEYDILISDIGMPDMDGYDLMRTVRQSDNGNANLPAIALTAYASTQDRERALEAGFQYHLAKPIDFEVFISAVKNVLDASKQN